MGSLILAFSLDTLIKALSRNDYISNAIVSRREAVSSLGYQAGRLPNPSIVSEYNAEEFLSSAEQFIPNPRVLSIERDMWRNELQGTYISTSLDSFMLVLELKRLYYDALFSKLKLEVLEQGRKALEEFLQIARKGYALGKYPYTNVLMIEARKKHMENLMDLERSRYEGKLSLISQLVGFKVDSISYVEHTNVLEEEQALSLVDSSYTLRLLHNLRRSYDLQYAYQKASRFPGISLSAGFIRTNEYPNGTLNLGFALSIPIFNTNAGNIRYYEYLRKATEYDIAFQKQMLEARIHALYISLSKLSSAFESINKDEIPKIEQAYAQVERMYSLGRSSYLEVMDVFENLVEKRMESLEILYRMHQVCLDIESILGRCILKEE